MSQNINSIGVPKEIQDQEKRVALTPKNCRKLIEKGFTVFLESGAGTQANYSDDSYRAKGVSIVDSVQELHNNASLILKIQAPTPSEIEGMKKGQILFCLLQPGQNPELLESLSKKGVNAIAMDAIPRISRAQKMDVLSSMANIAGYRSVIEGANHYGRFLNGQITAAGKIDPAKVLVIGAGVAGLAAIGTANSLGAIVRAFDTRSEVEEQIQSMGAQFLTVNIDEDGGTSSGYSKVMSKEFIEAEMALFKEQAKEVDMIITTAQIPGREAPKLILDYHVEAMKPGSVIVDLAANSGGNCTLTKKGEIYTTDNDVTIIGKIDLLANQASELYGNNLTHLLDDMGGGEEFQVDMTDDIISRAMVSYDGKINWPPEPLPVSSKPKPTKEETTPTVKKEKKTKNNGKSTLISLIGIAILLGLAGQFAPKEFMQHFTVFVLAVFVGWQVIWNVSHSLHTPLMAVTNAISGIIIIGGILQVLSDWSSTLSIIALFAVFVACINIVGGFFVTQRMLNMFKK